MRPDPSKSPYIRPTRGGGPEYGCIYCRRVYLSEVMRWQHMIRSHGNLIYNPPNMNGPPPPCLGCGEILAAEKYSGRQLKNDPRIRTCRKCNIKRHKTHPCLGCGEVLTADKYSRRQLKKRANGRTCRKCIKLREEKAKISPPCLGCGEVLTADKYSNTQRRLAAHSRTCEECVNIKMQLHCLKNTVEETKKKRKANTEGPTTPKRQRLK